MKLHSPGFERALRRGVRRAVRSSPALKREFRIANRYHKQYTAKWLGRTTLSVALGFLVWHVAERATHPIAGLAVLSLWTFGFIFVHAQALWTSLFRSTDLPALSLLPITEGTVFRWELQKFLRGSITSLIDLLVGFGALALFLNFSAVKWCAVLPITALSWLMPLALGALCAARLPRWPYQMICAGLFLMMGAIFAAGKVFGWELVVATLDRCAPTLNLLLPTGWAVSLFQLLLADRQWITLGLLLPVGILIWTIQNSLSRLRDSYRFEELTRAEPSDLVPDGVTDALSVDNTPEPTPRHLGVTAIEEIVQSRIFLASPQWAQQGWFERMLWRWLSDREKALAEMVFPSGLSISVRWIKIFRTLGAAALIGFVAGSISGTMKLWIIAIGIFVSFCLVLTQILETGRAFQPILCSGVKIPLYAGFATGLRELSRLLVKFSAVQIPALLAWGVICGVLITHLIGLPATDGIMYGLRATCLMFASRYLFIALGFSSGTNDSARFRLRTLTLLAVMVAFGGLFLLLGAAGLLVPEPGPAFAITALAMLDAYVFFRIYGWFYHRNYFDLMSPPG